jgi:alpha-glucuronidase
VFDITNKIKNRVFCETFLNTMNVWDSLDDAINSGYNGNVSIRSYLRALPGKINGYPI